MSDDFSDDDFDEVAASIIAKQNVPAPKPSINWHCLQVHPDQSTNPILNSISNVAYQINENIKTDFATSSDVGILYLSLKYHNYRPKYIEQRIEKLERRLYRVLVVLVFVDTSPADLPCRNLSVLCTRLGVSLVLGFSQTEVVNYIENFKILEKKSVDSLRPTLEEGDRLSKMLSHARGVNSTDADNLLNKFGSVKKLVLSTQEKVQFITSNYLVIPDVQNLSSQLDCFDSILYRLQKLFLGSLTIVWDLFDWSLTNRIDRVLKKSNGWMFSKPITAKRETD